MTFTLQMVQVDGTTTDFVDAHETLEDAIRAAQGRLKTFSEALSQHELDTAPVMGVTIWASNGRPAHTVLDNAIDGRGQFD